MREELKGLYQEYFKREDTYVKYWNNKIDEDKNLFLMNLRNQKNVQLKLELCQKMQKNQIKKSGDNFFRKTTKRNKRL